MNTTFNLNPATTAATPSPFGFGATSNPLPSFGSATTSALSAPLSSAPPASTGFSFGATTITPVQQPATTGFSFGAGATNNANVPSSSVGGFGLGGGFGTTITTAAGFGQQPVASVALTPAFGGFGTAVSSAAAPALSFGGFGASTTAAPPVSKQVMFSTPAFGAPAGTSTGSSLTGAATPGTMTTPSIPAATTSTTFGLGGSALAPSTISGLGGQAFPGAGGAGSSNPSMAGHDGKGGSKTLKESQLPNELAQTVEEFKRFVKEEKSVSSDIAHISSKIHQKIQEDIDVLNSLVKAMASGLSRNKAQLDKLKLDASQELVNVEIAQRTRDTPPALQYENVAPYEYFARIVGSFEQQMLHYRRQIEETEQHLQSMASQNTLSLEDITKAIQKLHATFTNLAARFQKVHEAIKLQKDSFLLISRLKYGSKMDDIFDKNRRALVPSSFKVKSRIPDNYVGPSPFSGQQDLLALARASLSSRPAATGQQSQGFGLAGSYAPPPYGSTTSGGFSTWGAQQNTSSSAMGGGGGLFNQTSSLGNPSTPGLLGNTMSPFGNSNQSSFLQTGGKRGKH